MNIGRMVGALAGSFGGAALGGAVGGRTGRLVGSMLGSMVGSRGISNATGGIGDALGGLKDKLDGDDDVEDVELPEETAMVLMQAMCNAAKADGHVDDEEIDAIVSRAGELDDEAEAFIRSELAAPLNLDEFIESVPGGMEVEVYTISLLPIDVDTIAEAEYLADLRLGLGLSDDKVADIHEALGVPLD